MNIEKNFRYLVIGVVLVTLSATISSSRAFGQPGTTATVQETEDKYKVDTYTKFVENYKTNRLIAYETAKAYLQRYAKDNDQYSQYVKLWVAAYEKELHQHQLWQLAFTDRNFVEAFKLGKQVLAEQPDQLDSLIALGAAGYLAAIARNETYNAEAIGYAKKAIRLIESGKAPDSWDPFKGKDDALAHLHFTIGVLTLKTAPNDALPELINAAQFDTDIKNDSLTYFFIASAYQNGPYAKMSAEYQKNFAEKAETPESKQALEKLDQLIDRIIDAYARAVAAAGNDPQKASNKTAWLTQLTTFYKFRHADSDAGLSELIAGVMNKPLPSRP